MKVSVCIITWNEEELLPGLLAYMNAVKGVDEICVLDSNSTDRTQQILTEFKPVEGKILKWDTCEFVGFDTQRQKNMDMATNEWIWLSDADEIICNIDDLLSELPGLPHINVVQCPHILTLYPDRKHALCDSNGVFIYGGAFIVKMVRKGFATWMPERKCHEILVDANGRKLYPYSAKDGIGDDILRTRADPRFKHIGIKHLSYLKSKKARLAKGDQWLKTGMIQESKKHGIPVYSTWWVEADERLKEAFRTGELTIQPIPEQYYDLTTELF